MRLSVRLSVTVTTEGAYGAIYAKSIAACLLFVVGFLRSLLATLACDLSLPPLSSSYAHAAGVEKPHRRHLRSLRRSRADGAGVAEQDSDHHRR